MPDFLITQKQLETISDSINNLQKFELAQENWNRFSFEEKESIVECLKFLYPENVNLISEASWYNTLGDIVGIFDPTGVVDLVNGISYIRQGDKLFGFLSLVSAVPYIGDVVAKPLMAGLKVSAPTAKSIRDVMKLVEVGKTAEANKLFAKLVSEGGIAATFAKGISKVAGKLRGLLERVPNRLFGGLKKTIFQWMDVFENYAKNTKSIKQQGQSLLKGMKGFKGGAGAVVLKKADQLKYLGELQKAIKETPGLFSGYRTTKGLLSWKTIFRGLPQLMNRNASVRALMRQSKWWLGFLDYIGIANFVGPDELKKQMGDREFESKLTDYQKNPGSEKNFRDEFGYEETETSDISQNASSKESQKDPFAKFLDKLFKDSINPLP